MTRLALSSLLVYAVGCVIPTPLEAETTTPASGQPVIILGKAPADFGPLTITPQLSTFFTFDFEAFDPNAADQLYASVFHVDGPPDKGTYTLLQPPTPMVATKDDPTTREISSFNTLAYCCLLGHGCNSGAQVDQLVYAYVSLDGHPQPMQTTGPWSFEGAFDRKYWTITCE